MKRKIVFITDCVDIAYNEMRGVALEQLRVLKIDDTIDVEPVAAVYPFSIINGAFVLRLLAEVYPPGTVFSVILNPLQHRPERIFGKTNKKDFIFLGANTGVFSWFLKDFELAELYELNDPGFLPFGGKYIHAPAAAKLAANMDFDLLGKKFDAAKLLPFDIELGTIVHVDNFGLIKFYTTPKDFKEGDAVKLLFKGQKINAIFSKRMMSRPTGDWVVYPGSSLGLLELGKVRENGAALLDAAPGDVLTFV